MEHTEVVSVSAVSVSPSPSWLWNLSSPSSWLVSWVSTEWSSQSLCSKKVNFLLPIPLQSRHYPLLINSYGCGQALEPMSIKKFYWLDIGKRLFYIIALLFNLFFLFRSKQFETYLLVKPSSGDSAYDYRQGFAQMAGGLCCGLSSLVYKRFL